MPEISDEINTRQPESNWISIGEALDKAGVVDAKAVFFGAMDAGNYGLAAAAILADAASKELAPIALAELGKLAFGKPTEFSADELEAAGSAVFGGAP